MDINKEIVDSFLAGIFQNLSNITYRIIDLDNTNNFVKIKVIKKIGCYYKYEEIKNILTNDNVFTFNDDIFTIKTRAERSDLKDEIIVYYKIERGEV